MKLRIQEVTYIDPGYSYINTCIATATVWMSGNKITCPWTPVILS